MPAARSYQPVYGENPRKEASWNTQVNIPIVRIQQLLDGGSQGDLGIHRDSYGEIPTEPFVVNQGHVSFGKNPMLRDQMIGLIQEVCGPRTRRVQPQKYRKPYPEWIDRTFQIPREFKILDFTLFYGDGRQPSMEHIARFLYNVKLWLKTAS